jgi:excisionase family DNA binding protein
MYVSADEIAQKYGVSKGTVTAWRKKLGLPAFRMSKGKRGGLVLFNPDEVDRWMSRFKQGGFV